VEEFFDANIEDRQKKIAQEHGFTLQDHALSLYGSCVRENCPNRPSSKMEKLAKRKQ
jgi:Fur family ferric uptake transcriptional regulator